MGYMESHGRTLLANGFLIIPIKPGTKRPTIDGWEHARLGAADVTRYNGSGVGILCGQGAHPIVAIDVDTLHADLAARFVAWCHDNLGVTCERIGKAPKSLLVYRAAGEGWAKTTGTWFAPPGATDKKDRCRLEILGNGQQFVAYHIHPDTGAPYEWVDLFGGLEYMRADELPVITPEHVAAAVAQFEKLAAEAGLVQVTGGTHAMPRTLENVDALVALSPPVGLTLDDARKLIEHLDCEDYDTWLRAGMALHHEFSGDDAALALWDEWSARGSNYKDSADIEYRWAGFGRGGHTPTTARWLLMAGHKAERDYVRGEKRAALDEVKSRITACRDSIDLVNDIARAAGTAAGEDLALRAELAGLIRARFKELTDTSLPMADVRAAMASGRVVPTIERQRRAMTEFGNAERMLDHYGRGLMFVPELAAWFTWTGVYWKRAAGVELEHLAKETIRALPDEAKQITSDDERAAFFKFCAISQRAIMVRNMVSLAQSDPRVVVGVSSLDAEPNFLGAQNGVIDLRTGALLPPDQSYHITAATSVDYKPEAKAPLFERTLNDVFFNDSTMVDFFQRLVGYAICGNPTEDVLVIPYGNGSNGKSTILGAIRDVLGDYARTASAETFLSVGQGGGSAGGPREDVLRLRGARFVYVSEPDEGSELREGLIKSMTGGESLPARGIHAKATVEVSPTWVAFMPTNHRPIVKGDDHAIWRRLLPVPFTRNFDDDVAIDKDTGRADKLRAESEGILAWCVRGALMYRRDGLGAPGDVNTARTEYKADMDLLGEWLAECCDMGGELNDTNANLWSSWEMFARARGELKYISSSKSLGRRLTSRGFASIKNVGAARGRGWSGLRVRSPEI